MISNKMDDFIYYLAIIKFIIVLFIILLYIAVLHQLILFNIIVIMILHARSTSDDFSNY